MDPKEKKLVEFGANKIEAKHNVIIIKTLLENVQKGDLGKLDYIDETNGYIVDCAPVLSM